MAERLKELRQAEADNAAAQAKVKAELGKFLDVPRADRGDEYRAQREAKKAELGTLEQEAAEIAADLATAIQVDEERAHRPLASGLHKPRTSSGGVQTSGEWEAAGDDEAVPSAFATPIVYHGLRGMTREEGLRAAFGQQLIDVHRARTQHVVSPQLAEIQAAAQGAGETIGADGGLFVQTDVASELIRNIFDTGQLLRRLRRIPVGPNSNGTALRAVDETSRATGSRWGGVQAYWVDEGTAPTASKPRFRKLELKLNKAAALGYATDELLQDGVAMGSIMFQAFQEELTFLVEDAIINGTGAGQPLGILNADAEVSVAKETGQAAATIVKENIDKMYSRMWARSRGNSVWLINQDTEPQLEQLSAVVGTGGVPVYLPPGGIADTPNARLKGRPVVPVEYCATLGTVGDILLVDLNQYLFIAKLLQTASSMHVAFTTDEQAFRVTWRVDGKPAWISALTPFKGSNTQSPFISLATRS